MAAPATGECLAAEKRSPDHAPLVQAEPLFEFYQHVVGLRILGDGRKAEKTRRSSAKASWLGIICLPRTAALSPDLEPWPKMHDTCTFEVLGRPVTIQQIGRARTY